MSAGWTGDGTDVASDLLGPLAPLVQAGVTDVLVNGPGRVWVDGQDGLHRVSVPGLDSDVQVRALAVRLAAAGGRRLDDASPWVDARLPDGVRLHAVLPVLCRGGTHVSLRVPHRSGTSLEELCDRGSLSPGLALALREVVASRVGLLVVGSTGAGKTTLLDALLGCVPGSERIVVVEDAAELSPRHPHVVSLEARPGNVEGAGAIGLDVLVRQALRMRPDRIVVGECRGPEVKDLLLAMGAGHAGAATLHAAGAEQVPLRLAALAGTAGVPAPLAMLQLRAAVEVVVPVVREPSGRRRVTGLWGWAEGRPHPDHGGIEPALGPVPPIVRLLDGDGRQSRPRLRAG